MNAALLTLAAWVGISIGLQIACLVLLRRVDRYLGSLDRAAEEFDAAVRGRLFPPSTGPAPPDEDPPDRGGVLRL